MAERETDIFSASCSWDNPHFRLASLIFSPSVISNPSSAVNFPHLTRISIINQQNDHNIPVTNRDGDVM
jgi:hypothetical protein